MKTPFIVDKNTREFWKDTARRSSCRFTFKDKVLRSGSFSFYPETLEAYSYGSLILKPVKRALVVNSGFYSNTTCKHQNKLRRLLRFLGLEKRTVETGTWISLDRLNVLPVLHREMHSLRIEIDRKGSRKDRNAYRRERIAELKKRFKRFQALGCVLSDSDKLSIEADLAIDEKNRLEALSEKNTELTTFTKELYEASFRNVSNQ